MTKKELIKNTTEKIEGMVQKDVESVLDALCETIKECMSREEKVTLPEIGTFSVKDVPERRGKIMLGDRKGEDYVVPAHREPKFKLTKDFKQILL